MHTSHKAIAGFDLVRFAALGCVAGHHALSLVEMEKWSRLGPLSIGKLGVALLLTLAGILAIQTSHEPLSWLIRRISKLFPAYWIVLAITVVLTWYNGHRDFDAGQVLSQFLGLGLFTHRSNLIYTPTWFISIILVCYIGTTIARLFRPQWAVTVLVTGLLAAAVYCYANRWQFDRAMTYFAASLIPLLGRLRIPWLLAAGFGGAAVWQIEFAYPAIAIAVVEASRHVPRVPRIFKVAASYSYEFYLVHGLALFGAVALLDDWPVLAIVSGVALAVIGSVLLRRTVDWMALVLRRTQPLGEFVRSSH